MFASGYWTLWRLCVLFAVLCSGVEVEAVKIRLTKQTRLATLFSGPSFSGNYFSIEGIYNSCYNVLKNSPIESAMLEGGTGYYEVWGVLGCGEEGNGKDKPREIYGAIPTLMWGGVGEGKGKGKDEVKRDMIEAAGVKSLRCFERKVLEKKE